MRSKVRQCSCKRDQPLRSPEHLIRLHVGAYSLLPPMTATLPNWPVAISKAYQAVTRPYSPLWNFSSIGGTNFRTLASMAFEEVDMEGCCEVNCMGCSRLPTWSTRCVMNTICWNGILRKQMAKGTSMEHGVLVRATARENRSERA